LTTKQDQDNPPPSLHPHYRDFITTTRRSVPLPRIGTQPLTVLAAWGSPLSPTGLQPDRQQHRGEGFPRSALVPVTELAPPSCRAATWPGMQEPAKFIPGQQLDPGFGNHSYAYDTSTVVHSRSPSRHAPDASRAPFPQCSSPRLIHRSNLRRFEISPCVSDPGGPTSITSAAPRQELPSTSEPPVVFVAHDRRHSVRTGDHA
jgi:hypothetical protein